MDVEIRPLTESDWPAARRIYQDGLDTGQASFEIDAPDWPAFDRSRRPSHRFVAMFDGSMAGWVAVSSVSSRPVYAGVVEHSIYVASSARGRGVGAALLAALTVSTERAGIWTIQSAIFPTNAASLRLHEAAGFRVVGTRERLGQRHGEWRDVVLVERRSPLI